MSPWQTIIRAGDPSRRSRFHTHDGSPAPLRAVLRWPVALAEWGWCHLSGRRLERPWIPPSATRDLARRLACATAGLEVGAGMSTLWLASRVGRLVSIEADVGWHAQLARILAARHHTHVELHHRWVASEMADFSSIADASLDVCVIDGGPRLACLLAALPKLRPGGCLYADNTDSNPDVKTHLQAVARDRGWPLTFHRGFPPACLYLSEGAILERPPSA